VGQIVSVIVTLTANTGLDRVIFLPRFGWSETVRATYSILAMGGKGTDVSMVLAELGEPSLALGFAAGRTGEQMARMLEDRGVTCDFVWTDGETRTNEVLIDTDKNRQTTITLPGLTVRQSHLEQLRFKLSQCLERAACLVLGGSLPQGMGPDSYQELIQDARAAGVPTLFDASGPGLRSGVQALPSILKLNQSEMEELSGRRLTGRRTVHRAAQRYVAQGVERVVLTMGAQGLWSLDTDQTYFVPPLPLTPVNTAGAGDGLMAGLAIGVASEWPWDQALRLGVAAAAAVCLTPGTAKCQREDVDRLLPEVRIIPHQEEA
jgi:1-phosphofructokinase family hexose kinase